MANAHKFKDAIRGSTTIIYPNIGHLPYEELAEKTATDVKNFLEGRPATAE